MTRLFHLVTPEDWEAFRRSRSDRFAPASLAGEGFCHLSFAEQLDGTLAAHFANASALLLVEVDAASVTDALRLEPSRGGALFPHLTRAFARPELVRFWSLRREGERWDRPRLGAAPAGDLPPGAPLFPADRRD